MEVANLDDLHNAKFGAEIQWQSLKFHGSDNPINSTTQQYDDTKQEQNLHMHDIKWCGFWYNTHSLYVVMATT